VLVIQNGMEERRETEKEEGGREREMKRDREGGRE
jgi:hypothetical protein